MKYLIIYAHPNPASFNHAIMEIISEELKNNNKDFVVRDLYQINFNPILKTEDLTAIENGAVLEDVKKEQEHIRSADVLILIFPIWWSSMPAILKGYIDRVFSLKFAYDITADGAIGLFKGKRIFLVSTTGASKDQYDKEGAFQMMNLSMDTAIFQFSGMEVIGHKYFSSVPSVSDKDRKQMLEEFKLLVREKVL